MYYSLQKHHMDKRLKTTLLRIRTIVNNPSPSIHSHTIYFNRKYLIDLRYNPNGKWTVGIIEKNGEMKKMASLNPNQVIGWVYGAINRIRYLKYNKNAKIATRY